MAIAEGHGEPGIDRISPAEGRDYAGRVSLWCAQYVFPMPSHSDAGQLDGAPGNKTPDCGLPRRHRDIGEDVPGGYVLFADFHAKFVKYHDAASIQAALPFYPSVTGIDQKHAPMQPPQAWNLHETSPGCW